MILDPDMRQTFNWIDIFESHTHLLRIKQTIHIVTEPKSTLRPDLVLNPMTYDKCIVFAWKMIRSTLGEEI